MDKHQETNLIARAKAGDTAAFGQLVCAYQSNLRLSARQWTGDAALADDMAQEAFIRAWQKLNQFDGRARFSSWLYRIAFNHWLNVKARYQPATACNDDTPEPQAEFQPCADRDIARALARLSEPQRLCIHLCLQRDFTHTEAADILNLPVGTVKTHINRGRIELQTLMAEYSSTTEAMHHG